MSRRINAVIRDQAVQVLKKHDLLIRSDLYWEYKNNLVELGQSLWKNEFRECLGDEFHDYLEELDAGYDYSETIMYLSSFGYTIGTQIYEIISGDGSRITDVGHVNALFNVFVGLFDRICDERTDLLAELTDRIFPGSLVNALNIEHREEDDTPHFHLEPDDNADLKLVVIVLEDYLKRCRALQRVSNNRIIWDEFSRSILTMYESEIRSPEVELTASNDLDDIYSILRNKGSLLAWAIYLTSALPGPVDSIADMDFLKEQLLRFGDIFWIIDDIVDSVEDLDNNKWSYTWLKLASVHGIEITGGNGRLRDREELLNELINHGVITESAHDLCNTYRYIKEEFPFPEYDSSRVLSGIEVTILSDLYDSLRFLE